jgi:hypothetical protein
MRSGLRRTHVLIMVALTGVVATVTYLSGSPGYPRAATAPGPVDVGERGRFQQEGTSSQPLPTRETLTPANDNEIRDRIWRLVNVSDAEERAAMYRCLAYYVCGNENPSTRSPASVSRGA